MGTNEDVVIWMDRVAWERCCKRVDVKRLMWRVVAAPGRY